jgi:hypothetical protein
LQHSRILKFEKDVENASATNNKWKTTKRLTKCQTHTCTPVIHGRNKITYTPQDKATPIEEVYEDQFRPNPEEQTFENFYRLIRTEVNTHLQNQPPLSHRIKFHEQLSICLNEKLQVMITLEI